MLWHSFGTITALLQEIINIYPAINPPSLTVSIFVPFLSCGFGFLSNYSYFMQNIKIFFLSYFMVKSFFYAWKILNCTHEEQKMYQLKLGKNITILLLTQYMYIKFKYKQKYIKCNFNWTGYRFLFCFNLSNEQVKK